MAKRALARLATRLLARLGEEAVLRGVLEDPPIRVDVQNGVEVIGTSADQVFERTVATIKKTELPVRGDTLAIGKLVAGVFVAEANYIVDSPPFKDNGYTVHVVLRDA